MIANNKLYITLTIAALVSTAAVGFADFASAAVAFNTFDISYSPSLNHDLPLIDAKNFTKNGSFSASQADHDNGVSADQGDVIEFQIYYHNGSTPEDIAHNVIVKATLPGGTKTDHEVSASIDSDETAPVSSSGRGGNIVIHVTGQPQTLEFISGSVAHFPNRAAQTIVPSNGSSLLGSGLNIGDIKGCFDFSGFVRFKARVGNVQADRNLTIQKKVLNVTRGDSFFQDSVTANPGDRVRFEIRADIGGNIPQNHVIVRDILPSRLNYISGTVRQDGSGVSNESSFFGGGIDLGTLFAGTSRTFTFEANVSGSGVFSGVATLINTANVRSDQISTRQDDAVVTVQIVGGAQFTLRKTAFNLTKSVDATTVPADPGDIITYTLYYKNTGGITISDVVIEDSIHDVLELAEITNQGGAVSVNSVIRYSPVEVQPGVEIARTFQVRVRHQSLFPASSDLFMTNIYGNEVRVQVRKPTVTGTTTPPRTGPGEWFAISLAAMATAGYWLYRRRKQAVPISTFPKRL